MINSIFDNMMHNLKLQKSSAKEKFKIDHRRINMIQAQFTDIMDAIEIPSEFGESFLHLKTGKVCFVNEEVLRMVEDEESSDLSLDEESERVKDYLENPDDYLALPSQEDADEYRMMEDFVMNLEDEKAAGHLQISLKGKGAFRRFKDSVIFLGIEKDWYKFRDERYRKFVLEWCEDNGIHCDDIA